MDYDELLEKELSGTFSENLVNLMKSILKINPKERLSFAEIIKHPWFEGHVDEKLNEEFDYKEV